MGETCCDVHVGWVKSWVHRLPCTSQHPDDELLPAPVSTGPSHREGPQRTEDAGTECCWVPPGPTATGDTTGDLDRYLTACQQGQRFEIRATGSAGRATGASSETRFDREVAASQLKTRSYRRDFVAVVLCSQHKIVIMTSPKICQLMFRGA